jgi:hypothetical protein
MKVFHRETVEFIQALPYMDADLHNGAAHYHLVKLPFVVA